MVFQNHGRGQKRGSLHGHFYQADDFIPVAPYGDGNVLQLFFLRRLIALAEEKARHLAGRGENQGIETVLHE